MSTRTLELPPTYAPPWLPASLRQRLQDLRLEFRFTRPERKVMRKKQLIPVSEWAARNFVLTDGPLKGGFWRPEMVPWSAGQMDAAFFPSVRKVVNCKGVQSAGSTMISVCLAYAVDRRPGDTMIIMPNQNAARKRIQDRIIPMIEQSPVLSPLFTGKEDDKASFRIKLLHMLIYAGWAGSPTSLGDTPAKYVIKDEADKWQEADTSKAEASSHKLADKRTTTFAHDCKTWDNSTPTIESGHIWQALLTETQIICSYWVRCPDCGTFQVMISRQIKWPGGKEASPVAIEAGRLAYYVCPHCGSQWDDYKRDLAAQNGEWRVMPTAGWEQRLERLKEGDHTAMAEAVELFAYLRAHRPANIGFHTPAWFSRYVSLSKSAAAIIRAATLGLDEVKDLANNFAAEPWKKYGAARQDDQILALRDDRPEKLVPSWALSLVLTADVQKPGIWYELRAHDERQSAGIRYGYLAKDLLAGLREDGLAGDFAALAEVLAETYRTAAGEAFPVRFGLVDSGYRTDEVYAFCRLSGRCAPTKGAEAKRVPISYAKIDTMPGTGKLIPGGLQLVHFDSNFFKDALAHVLQVKPGDPGYWALHGGTGEDYARQYTAEFKNEETGLWEQKGSQPNHLWDCGVLQLVARRVLETQGLFARLARERQESQQPRPASPTTGAQAQGPVKLW